MIKWSDEALSQGFQALTERVSQFPSPELFLYGANKAISRDLVDASYYAPLSPSAGTWLTQPQFWPIVHAGDGRFSKTSEVFTFTPRSNITVYGWIIYAVGFGGVIFGEKAWDGGLLLKANEPFKIQVTIVLSDGCPSCVC